MALKNCPECSKEVSSKADACPHCGFNLKKSAARKRKLFMLGFLVFSVIIIRAVNKPSQSNYIANLEKKWEQQRNEYENNRAGIITKMSQHLNNTTYRQGFEYADQFSWVSKKDKEFHELKNKLEEKYLVEEVKILPASKVAENQKAYNRLRVLDPKNKKYIQKSEYYSKLHSQQAEKESKIAEKNKKAQARRIASFGEPPAQSAWDGSYRVVEKYLKRVANDPSSIDISSCSKVFHNEKAGWLVYCEYRGKNGFGGMVRNANWFEIKHNQVLKMKPASTYKL